MRTQDRESDADSATTSRRAFLQRTTRSGVPMPSASPPSGFAVRRLRTAAALAVLLLLAAAPAKAQKEVEVWSANLTVGRGDLGGPVQWHFGFVSGGGGVGSLSEKTFEYAGAMRTITQFYNNRAVIPDTISFVMRFPVFEVDRLELHVDGATLAFSDADIFDIGSSSNRVRYYTWRNPVAAWEVGQTKAVKITYPRKLVFSDSSAAVTEGSGDLAFWADVDPRSTEEIRFRVRTDDYYLAEAGTDYEPFDKVVTIPPGRTRAEFPVRLIDDSIAEDNEEFLVTVSEVRGADLHRAYGNTSEAQKSISAVGRILDDDGDGKAVITVTTRGQESVAEGENAVFWVNRLGGPPVDVGVIVEVAELGGDRVARQQEGTRTLTLKRGTPDMALALRIPTSADPEAGGDGRLSITVQEASEYTVGEPRSATVAVTKAVTKEERTLPTVTLRASRTSATEGEEVEFTLTRTGPAEAELDVRVDVSETGEVLTEYPWQSGFEPGESTATFTVKTRNDPASGTRSVVTVALTEDAERYRLGDPSSATVTVTEATGQQGAVPREVTISAGRASVREGNPVEVTLTRTGGGEAVTIGLRVSETGETLGAAVRQVPLVENAESVTVSLPTVADETDEADSVVTVEIVPDAERYDVGEPSSVAVTVEDDDEPAPLTAEFEDVPEAHDGERFTFGLSFSEEPDLSYRTLRDHAFEVGGGAVRIAKRQQPGKNRHWTITVEPNGYGEVSIRLPQTGDCAARGAICTGDGRRLSNSPSARVEGPPAEPLTAEFEDVPEAHDGERFTFGLSFSEEPDLSYRTLRDHAFEVGGGAVRIAKRRQQGSNRGWTITVEPSGFGGVSIRLPETANCDAQGAICTGDGRPLSHALSATVRAPVGVGVSDARVTEAAGAVVAFAVSLSRAASGRVTVDYATVDGTAQAGADYTAARGTLAFQAGESSKTIEVGVLDDAHDEGEETFTLTLSNASGGRLTDGEATGTIENRDPLPRALLARFGRTAAVHVVEHVEERMAAPRAPGLEGRFAGRELRPGMERDMALNFLSQLGASAGVQPAGMGSRGPLSGSPAAGAAPLWTPGPSGGGALMAAGRGSAAGVPGLGAPGRMGAAAGFGAPGPAGAPAGPGGGLNDGGLLQMGLGGGDLLTGSAFALNRETRHGGILSFWSRGAQSRFSGREGALSLGGDVRTTMFGADYAKGPLVAGLSLSHSRGLGEYAGVTGGQVASAVTGLYPWLGYKATDRITVWGVTGYGSGGLLLTPEGGPVLESGLSMAMAAAGTRGELFAGGASGFELAFKADTLWVGTSIDGVDGPAGRLKATAAAVTRFRTGLEGSRDYTLAGRLSLTPSVEVGLRHDGGDAENGAGMDIGGGLVVSDSSTGLAVDVRVRMLVVHQAEGFHERGMAVSLSYNPTPSTPLGFVARVAPSWGGEATSGAEALWGREKMAGLAHGGVAAGNRLDADIGYGLPVGSRFVGTPRVGFATSVYGRDYRLGYSLGVLNQGRLNFELGVDAQRRESPMLNGTDLGVLGRASLGW